MNWIQSIGKLVLDVTQTTGKISLFIWLLLASGFKRKGFLKLLIKQIFNTGVLSLPIILVAGLFVGMVLGLQLYTTLARFGSEEVLGVVTALSFYRELGPVLTAILFAARAGSALATEIGVMKTTQQLAALEMMAIDPMYRIFHPRLLASIIVMPALNFIFVAVGLIGSWYIGSYVLGIDGASFWTQIQDQVDWVSDVLNGTVKSFIFGCICAILALFYGYDCRPTVDGTSLATTKTVVYSCLLVLGSNVILTAIMF